MQFHTTKAVPLISMLLVLGCGRAINRTAERKIRETLPGLFGTAKQYRVHINNPAERTLSGRFRQVSIEGTDVMLPNGILLDGLSLNIKGIETADNRIKKVQEVRFTLTFSESTLNEVLAQRMPSGQAFTNPQFTFRNNTITITGQHSKFGIPLRAIGRLYLNVEQRLALDLKASVIGMPISASSLAPLKKNFEQAVDLRVLPFPVQITGVEVSEGRLKLSGTADINTVLEQMQTRKP